MHVTGKNVTRTTFLTPEKVHVSMASQNGELCAAADGISPWRGVNRIKPRFVLEEGSPVEDSGIPYSLRFYAESGWRLGPNSYFTGKILCKLVRVLSYVLFENHMNFK